VDGLRAKRRPGALRHGVQGTVPAGPACRKQRDLEACLRSQRVCPRRRRASARCHGLLAAPARWGRPSYRCTASRPEPPAGHGRLADVWESRAVTGIRIGDAARPARTAGVPAASSRTRETGVRGWRSAPATTNVPGAGSVASAPTAIRIPMDEVTSAPVGDGGTFLCRHEPVRFVNISGGTAMSRSFTRHGRGSRPDAGRSHHPG
jgi:hypothetical protein